MARRVHQTVNLKGTSGAALRSTYELSMTSISIAFNKMHVFNASIIMLSVVYHIIKLELTCINCILLKLIKHC